MKSLHVKIALIYNFALPALLLNCVGIFVLKLINDFSIPITTTGWLEPFKDFSILIGSFIFVSYIPKMGYKKSIMIGTILGMLGCLLVALHTSLLTSQLFFMTVGAGFAFIKVSIYSSIGLITNNDTEHASLISILEGFFMAGVLAGFWIFGLFIKANHWSAIFWVLIALSVIGLILMLTAPLNESALKTLQQPMILQKGEHKKIFKSYIEMFKLLTQAAVWSYLTLTFCYLFVEQGITNWLPTYNNHVLHIASATSIEIASLLSAGFALGRIVFGTMMKYIHWRKVLTFCALSSLVVLLISIELSLQVSPHPAHLLTHWTQVPLVAYLLPLVGFLVGPIYPTLSSSILSNQPKHLHSAMSVWIVTISALGGGVGTIILGYLFGFFGGLTAISFLIAPIFILLVFTIPYYHQLQKFNYSAPNRETFISTTS